MALVEKRKLSLKERLSSIRKQLQFLRRTENRISAILDLNGALA